MFEQPPSPFQIGDLIANKYRVDGVIGAGGMGVVLAATHLDLDRKVAVKLIRSELAADESIVERLLLEARAAAKIRSRHVGIVLDVGRLDNGAPFIVMEHLEGQDLGALLERQGALGVVETTDLMMQACEALAEAHQANIVHRDLKPENLFITTAPDGTRLLKVLDFGIAKQLGDHGRRALTNPTTAVGSPQYMSPEQMQAAQVDTRADIWALGAILYECLSNRPAFGADTLPAVCAKVLGEQPAPLRTQITNLPPGLDELIAKCLQKNPAGRFGSVAELATALYGFGSPSAAASLRRVHAISAGSLLPSQLSAQPAHVSTGPTLLADGSKGTEKAMVVISESRGEARPKSKLPVVVGLLSLFSVAAGFIAWQLLPGRSEGSAASAAPSVDSPPAATAPDTAADTATGTAANSASATGQTAPSAPSANAISGPDAGAPEPLATTGTPSSPGSAKAPRPTRSGEQVRPSPGGRTPKPSPGTAPTPGSAWDPDNFGGRH